MSKGHVVLAAAGVATFGLCTYLFVAVNAAPSEPTAAPARDPQAAQVAEREPANDEGTDEGEAPKRRPGRRFGQAPAEPTGPGPAIESGQILTPALRPGANIDLAKDETMASANKAYDRGNLDEAMEIARGVLANDPNNVRMLRIIVSSSCILDDAATAQKSYLLLPESDRETMRVRCARYGVTFTES